MSELAPYVPEDFDSFWAQAMAEANSVRLDFHRSLKNDFDLTGFKVETIDFQGMTGRVQGWFAYPEGARRLPSFIWVPPYGRESLLPDKYGTREGFASLSLNFHGHEAFHQEKYAIERGYFAEGADDPETWVFRRMFQDAVIATRVLQAQIEVDEDRIGAMGMSQGAGISIWLGAHCPIIGAVCADMPFLSGISHTIMKTVYRYPLKEVRDFMNEIPLGEARVLNTLSYFDTMNQATRCQVPTHVSLGLKDPACRPETVRATFDALPGKKKLVEYDWGHDWHPDMVESNRNWLIENFG
ncbi:MAG: acetylxylan esterase [Chlorobia bacterium]|nr:acetylxylan esterase [Fimbriimonadaceae bacterium]